MDVPPRRSGGRYLATNMSSDPPDARKVMTANIREAFGRVVYSHKTHEKAREIESSHVTQTKWVNIILTALTGGSLVTTIVTNRHELLYVTAGLASVALAFGIFQLSFDPQGQADKHRIAANELWYLRELYINLLTDLRCGLSLTDATDRRDQLGRELKEIYSHAPDTSSAAYRAAQKALKYDEDMTFTNDEINKFLPTELHEAGGA